MGVAPLLCGYGPIAVWVWPHCCVGVVPLLCGCGPIAVWVWPHCCVGVVPLLVMYLAQVPESDEEDTKTLSGDPEDGRDTAMDGSGEGWAVEERQMSRAFREAVMNLLHVESTANIAEVGASSWV